MDSSRGHQSCPYFSTTLLFSEVLFLGKPAPLYLCKAGRTDQSSIGPEAGFSQTGYLSFGVAGRHVIQCIPELPLRLSSSTLRNAFPTHLLLASFPFPTDFPTPLLVLPAIPSRHKIQPLKTYLKDGFWASAAKILLKTKNNLCLPYLNYIYVLNLHTCKTNTSLEKEGNILHRHFESWELA